MALWTWGGSGPLISTLWLLLLPAAWVPVALNQRRENGAVSGMERRGELGRWGYTVALQEATGAQGVGALGHVHRLGGEVGNMGGCARAQAHEPPE